MNASGRACVPAAREREVRDGAWHIGRELWKSTYQERQEKKNIDQMVALVRRAVSALSGGGGVFQQHCEEGVRERDGIAKDDVRQALLLDARCRGAACDRISDPTSLRD